MVSHPEIYKNLVNFVHLQYEFIIHSTVAPFELPESTVRLGIKNTVCSMSYSHNIECSYLHIVYYS